MIEITRKAENKNKSLLQKQFDSFIALLLSLELLIKQKAWAEDVEFSTPSKYVLFIQERIKDFIVEGSIEVNNAMISPGIFNEAKYIMVALADELFLSLDWAGKKTWDENILESQVFQSHRAGQEIFSRIDDMLEAKDSSRYDLSYLYFNALAFGFLGKYKGRKSDHIKQYLESLYVLMHGGSPLLYQGKEKVFEQAYNYTITDYVPRQLVDYRPWYIVFALVFVFFIMSSGLVWKINTSSTMKLANDIIKLEDKGGRE